MTDPELLRAFVDLRDTDSLGTYIRRHEDTVLRFVSRLFGDRDLAQDVVQETFMKVARHPRKLLKIQKHSNWLLRVARNIGMDHVRRERRRQAHQPTIAAEASRAADARQVEGPARLEAAEEQGRVRDEIARLVPRQREVLLLRIQEQKSYREIAEITGLTATNVGFILHQAMKALAGRLEDCRPFDDTEGTP